MIHGRNSSSIKGHPNLEDLTLQDCLAFGHWHLGFFAWTLGLTVLARQQMHPG
jgi:hypothetical protein